MVVNFECEIVKKKIILKILNQLQGRRPQDNDELKISFNTPGSKVDRELTLDYVLNRRATTVTVGLKSPWKKADFTGELLINARILLLH